MKNVNDYEVSIRRVNTGNGEFEFVAIFEQFPDVIGVGDTREEALSEANANLKLYFDFCEDNNTAIPEPLEKNDLSTYSGKITLRLSKQLHRDLSDYSLKDGMSINSIVNDAIRFYLTGQALGEVVNASIDTIHSQSKVAPDGVNLNNSVWKNNDFNSRLN